MVLSADIKNALNEEARAPILAAGEQSCCPELLPLVAFIYTALIEGAVAL